MGDSRGLTLVEMLVAMAVMGLVATLLAGSLRTGVRAWETAEARTGRLERLVVVQNLLRRQLEGAVPGPSTDDAPAFAGEETALRLLGPSPMAGLPGLAAVTLRQEGTALLLEMARRHPDGGSDEARAETLLAGVARVRLRYFGPETPGAPPRWHPEWRDRPDLPTLVRLDIALVDGAPWPPLVAQPALAPARGGGGGW